MNSSHNVLVEGLQNMEEMIVNEQDLAPHYNLGDLRILSTPALIAFMERTSVKLVSDFMKPGRQTVGAEMNVRHLKAALPGEKLTCTAHLKYIDRHILFFDVAVLNQNHEEIGIGAHIRYIVVTDDFVKKISDK
jgi:predicted thioesterase